jgi:hypothetical protein
MDLKPTSGQSGWHSAFAIHIWPWLFGGQLVMTILRKLNGQWMS